MFEIERENFLAFGTELLCNRDMCGVDLVSVEGFFRLKRHE
jgi:hypothetical protein